MQSSKIFLQELVATSARSAIKPKKIRHKKSVQKNKKYLQIIDRYAIIQTVKRATQELKSQKAGQRKMKVADIEKIVKAFENELKAKFADAKEVYADCNAWAKAGKDRTYINLKVRFEDGKVYSYSAGFINNETNRYNAKYVQVNIQKKDFSAVVSELEKRAEEKKDCTVEDFEEVETVAEVAEGTVVIAKRNDTYCAMLKVGNALKKLTNYTCETASREMLRMDIEDFMKEHAPTNLENALNKLDEYFERKEKAKKEAEEKEYEERKTLRTEDICECPEGAVVVCKQWGHYYTAIRDEHGKMKHIIEYDVHEMREDCLYDIYDYLDYNNYDIPKSLENYA